MAWKKSTKRSLLTAFWTARMYRWSTSTVLCGRRVCFYIISSTLPYLYGLAYSSIYWVWPYVDTFNLFNCNGQDKTRKLGEHQTYHFRICWNWGPPNCKSFIIAILGRTTVSLPFSRTTQSSCLVWNARARLFRTTRKIIDRHLNGSIVSICSRLCTESIT